MKRFTGADVARLRELEKALKEIPRRVAIEIAASTASIITNLARQTFALSQNAYGDPWLPGMRGQTVTLVRTGRLQRAIQYVAVGTKLRARLGPKYAKYQIGLRPVLPRGKFPIAYGEIIRANANRYISESFRRAS
jgi:hypothetical protein